MVHTEMETEIQDVINVMTLQVAGIVAAGELPPDFAAPAQSLGGQIIAYQTNLDRLKDLNARYDTLSPSEVSDRDHLLAWAANNTG